MTRCVRLLVGRLGRVGGMPGARRWSPRSRIGLASVWCLATFTCRHIWRVIGWLAGVLATQLAVIPPGISALGGPQAFRLAVGTDASFCCGRPSASWMVQHLCPPWAPRVWLGWRCGLRGYVLFC